MLLFLPTNQVTANQDKTSRTILLLRQEITNLQLELMEYKQGQAVQYSIIQFNQVLIQ